MLNLILISISRSAFELWGHGRTTDELRRSLLAYPAESMVCSHFLHSKVQCVLEIYRVYLLINCLLYEFFTGSISTTEFNL